MSRIQLWGRGFRSASSTTAASVLRWNSRSRCPTWTTTPAQQLAEKAHQVCPYSNATRGNIDVKLVVTDD